MQKRKNKKKKGKWIGLNGGDRENKRTKKKRVIDFFWGGDKRLWLGHVAKV